MSEIALEITIPKLLFRRLQKALDDHPTESVDAFARNALSIYLVYLSSFDNQEVVHRTRRMNKPSRCTLH